MKASPAQLVMLISGFVTLMIGLGFIFLSVLSSWAIGARHLSR